jgi:hypothetical protein
MRQGHNHKERIGVSRVVSGSAGARVVSGSAGAAQTQRLTQLLARVPTLNKLSDSVFFITIFQQFCI